MRGVLLHVPLEVATTPANGECLVDRWWAVHPEKGVAFYFVPFGYYRSEEPAPQCNPDEHTARALTKRLNPDHEVHQIPAVYMAHAVRAAREYKKATNP